MLHVLLQLDPASRQGQLSLACGSSLLFTLEVNWAARYMAVSPASTSARSYVCDATAPSIQEDWNECTWLAIIAGYFYLTPFVFVASATDDTPSATCEVWRFFKSACP